MTCREVQALLVERRQEAPPEVFCHLEECPECARQEGERASRWRSLKELPAPPPGFSAKVVSAIDLRPAKPGLLGEDWLGGPWLRVLLGTLVGLTSGAASAGLDLAWQNRLTPSWLDSLLVPLARLLGTRAEPETDLLVILPAFLGLVALVLLSLRTIVTGKGDSLSTARVVGLALMPVTSIMSLFLGGLLLLGYIDWWRLSETGTICRWLVATVAISWGYLLARRRIVDVPSAAMSFSMCLVLAALLLVLADRWDDFRVALGLPALYYLRFELPPGVLVEFLALGGCAGGLILPSLAELSRATRGSVAAGLVGAILGGLGLLAMATSRLSPYGVFATADAVVWAAYPAPSGGPSAWLLCPGWSAHPLEPAESTEQHLRARFAQIDARGMFDLHRLKRIELARWESLPGLAEAEQQLARMRPRRRGWWGTGPAGRPGLIVHPDFSAAAQRMAALLPDNQEVQQWNQGCLESQSRPGGTLRGRLRSPVPVKVRLFQKLAGSVEADSFPQRCWSELDREATYWGWTALLVREPDADGEFSFAKLPAGDYLLAVLLPNDRWVVKTLPGVVTVAEGQTVDVGALLVTPSPAAPFPRGRGTLLEAK